MHRVYYVLNGRIIIGAELIVLSAAPVRLFSTGSAFYEFMWSFSCTICSSFLLNKPRNAAMKCIECDEVIETGINELIFMRSQ